MQHKNIAVLMTALDSDPQAETLRGIEAYGKQHGCNIAVFLWYTGAFERDKHNLGEVNIVNLPDLNLFDGVIVFANTLHMENNRRKLEKMLSRLQCPVVGIGCRLKNAYSVQTDNYTAMRTLVEHFVVEHKLKRIHFVKGIEGNSDGESRFQAYLDVLKEHQIPVIPERITQGDFYVTGGELAVNEILNSNLPFPEAIICANDTMAITVCDILQEKGYRIPEDVMVAGYDYSMEGQLHTPKLTTVRSPFIKLGNMACQTVLDVLEGKEVPEKQYIPDEVILNESCNCTVNIQAVPAGIMSSEVIQRKLIHDMILLEKSIMESEGLSDWIDAWKIFISQVRTKEFYYCTSEELVKQVFEIQAVEQEEQNVEERLAFPEKVKVLIAYQNGIFKSKSSFESKYAFDDLFQDTEQEKLYIFSPVHYLDRNFGYVVFVDSEFPMANPLYISWLISMGDEIENIRKQSLLKITMQRLNEMYIRDSLTGVLNRFGMERYFSEMKLNCMMAGTWMQMSFIDIDNLKKINDTYGHEEGDRIINAAAKILSTQSGKNYVVRYGGDEFIVMSIVQEQSEPEIYWEQVQKAIDEYNRSFLKKHGDGAELSMSFGYEIFEMDGKLHLEDCIHIVDEKMYIQKNNKKAQKHTHTATDSTNDGI